MANDATMLPSEIETIAPAASGFESCDTDVPESDSYRSVYSFEIPKAAKAPSAFLLFGFELSVDIPKSLITIERTQMNTFLVTLAILMLGKTPETISVQDNKVIVASVGSKTCSADNARCVADVTKAALKAVKADRKARKQAERNDD